MHACHRKIKALQALHHTLPLHLHQASAITLSKIKCFFTCYVHLHFLQGFKEIFVMVFKLQKGHTYMTWIIFGNVQRAETSKAVSKVTVLVFCILYHGDIYLHSLKKISNSYHVTSGHIYHRNHYFQRSKP